MTRRYCCRALCTNLLRVPFHSVASALPAITVHECRTQHPMDSSEADSGKHLLPAAACKGVTTSGLKFTVLPKLYPFAQAAAACKAAGLKLSDIDLNFAGSKGAVSQPPCTISVHPGLRLVVSAGPVACLSACQRAAVPSQAACFKCILSSLNVRSVL
jgi:hypothetical protein